MGKKKRKTKNNSKATGGNADAGGSARTTPSARTAGITEPKQHGLLNTLVSSPSVFLFRFFLFTCRKNQVNPLPRRLMNERRIIATTDVFRDPLGSVTFWETDSGPAPIILATCSTMGFGASLVILCRRTTLAIRKREEVALVSGRRLSAEGTVRRTFVMARSRGSLFHFLTGVECPRRFCPALELNGLLKSASSHVVHERMNENVSFKRCAV